MNFCPGELFLKLLARIGEWHQNLSEKTAEEKFFDNILRAYTRKHRRVSSSPTLLPSATKLGQGYVFTGVCDSVHRGGVCLTTCWDTTPPREQTSPPPRADPPGADTPWRRACWEIWSTRGWYASYWNAILLMLKINK